MKPTQVKDLMSSELITVNPMDPLVDFENHFKRRSIHHILVEDKSHNLIGIISSEDVARCNSWIVKDKIVAEDIMTEHPITVEEKDSINVAKSIFTKNMLRALPVKNSEGELVGIITTWDLLMNCKF